jgi:death-on-curing protein
VPDIDFLSVDDVLALHEHQIATYGGSLGVRDPGLLESAVQMPQAGFGGQYFHADLYEMAAAYLFHIAANHPFVDGNKRAAAAAAHAFLFLNGLTLPRSCEKLFERLVLDVAEGKSGKLEAAAFFRTHATQSA